jgi:hypothetical protein
MLEDVAVCSLRHLITWRLHNTKKTRQYLRNGLLVCIRSFGCSNEGHLLFSRVSRWYLDKRLDFRVAFYYLKYSIESCIHCCNPISGLSQAFSSLHSSLSCSYHRGAFDFFLYNDNLGLILILQDAWQTQKAIGQSSYRLSRSFQSSRKSRSFDTQLPFELSQLSRPATNLASGQGFGIYPTGSNA